MNLRDPLFGLVRIARNSKFLASHMPGKCCVGAVFCLLSSVFVTHCVREIPARSQVWDVTLSANAAFKIKSTFWHNPPPYCFWAAWNYFSEHWCDLHFLFQSRVDPIIKSCHFSWKLKVFVTNGGFLKKLTLFTKNYIWILKKNSNPEYWVLEKTRFLGK